MFCFFQLGLVERASTILHTTDQKWTRKKKYKGCSESLVWFVVFDNFCLDLVGLVLSEFVWLLLFRISQKEKNKYGSVQELRSTFGHLKSFKRLA